MGREVERDLMAYSHWMGDESRKNCYTGGGGGGVGRTAQCTGEDGPFTRLFFC